jgi:hypothetical protein
MGGAAAADVVDGAGGKAHPVRNGFVAHPKIDIDRAISWVHCRSCDERCLAAAFTSDEHACAPVRADAGMPVLTMEPVSDSDPAAVDREHDTVSECRLRRGEVDDGCGDLLRGAQSPGRCE